MMQFIVLRQHATLGVKDRIWPKYLALTRKFRRLQQPFFFLAVFRLAEFLSGGFSANAENIRLGGLGLSRSQDRHRSTHLPMLGPVHYRQKLNW